MAERTGRRGVRLGAALFNGDHGRLAEEVARVEEAGLDFLHLDVFDGRLVGDLAFSPRTIAHLRPLTALPFEVHLAAHEPERLLPALADAGVDLVLVHVEGAPMLFETLFAARERGLRAGVALGLATPLEHLAGAAELADAALLLSRVTGESARGASFDARVLPRLRRARELADAAGAALDLQVAGGVNAACAAGLAAGGATALAFGAGLYRAPDMGAAAAELRRLVEEDACRAS